MEIPRTTLDSLTREINAISDFGQNAFVTSMAQFISGYIQPDRTIANEDIAFIRDVAIDVMESICGNVADMAASRAAEFYDNVRTQSGADGSFSALAKTNRSSQATDGAVRALVQDVINTGSVDGFIDNLCRRIDREVKKAAGDCVLINGERDPSSPRFARVPTGRETCLFCIMLASRGFVYRSQFTAGAGLNHYHPNCDCRIVPGFQGMTVEGYDPDALYRLWDRLSNPQTFADNLYSQKKKTLAQEADALNDEARKTFREAKKQRNYSGIYEPFLKQYEGDGLITAQYWAHPEGKEIQLAGWLAAAGNEIEFLYPSSEKGASTPDIRINGELWEIKRLETTSSIRLKRRISEAADQSSSVIIDLSVNTGDIDALTVASVEMLDDSRIDQIMIIAKGKAVIYT